MTETNSNFEGWSEDAKQALYKARHELLVELISPTIFTLDGIQDMYKIAAAVTLAQEGFLELDQQAPGILRLTPEGTRFAIGAVALKNG